MILKLICAGTMGLGLSLISNQVVAHIVAGGTTPHFHLWEVLALAATVIAGGYTLYRKLKSGK